MTIAGGILGALFHRERTGEAKTVDVSLLGVGMWAMSPGIALSLQLDHPWRPGPGGATAPFNPLVGTYRTQDGRFLAFSCLQGFHYWPGACRVVGREDLIEDPRFATPELLSQNAGAAREILAEIFLGSTLDEWRTRLEEFAGQWSFAQDTLEVVEDPQTLANGYIGETATADGTPYRLVTTPVQFSGSPAAPKRGPEFNEHCDEILTGLGYDQDAIIELKVAGVVA
jgi:crotonobetainyl-CoA:carnitine CoA-transferase CaiB-like acyl-CoA transferase